jgi:hypothetical protein
MKGWTSHCFVWTISASHVRVPETLTFERSNSKCLLVNIQRNENIFGDNSMAPKAARLTYLLLILRRWQLTQIINLKKVK